MSIHTDFLDSLTPSAIRNITAQIRNKAAEGIKIVNFAGGMPDETLFPSSELAEITVEAIKKDGGKALQYAASDGYNPLRKTISELMEKFQVKTEFSNILITCGAQQALSYLTRGLVTPVDTIVCENPTYVGALDTFRTQTDHIVGIDMDDDGINTDKLEKVLQTQKVRFIYVIPDFQNPSGRCMSVEKRNKLVALAEKYNTFIIEDAPYAMITFNGNIKPAIKSFDKYDRVIYLGSFSKTICPGIRIGWVNADQKTLQQLIYLKMRDDLQVTNLSQYQVHGYLSNYDFDSHLDEIRSIYAVRCQHMVERVKESFPSGSKVIAPDGGIFLWIELPGEMDAEVAFGKVFERNIAYVPGTYFFPNRGNKNTMRLNFCTNSIETIDRIIPEMGKILRECEEER